MITLVGAGMLGSLWTEETAKLFFANDKPLMLNIIDFDAVEGRNVANQVFRPAHSGRNKAEVLAEILRDYKMVGAPVVERLTEKNREELLADSEIVVSAVDNMETRNLLWYHCVAAGIPLLHLGVSQKGTGAVEWSVGHEYDSWTLSPVALKGKKAPPPALEKLRPCELVGFRGLGLNCALAGAKAASLLFDIDSEKIVEAKKPGTLYFTTWTITSTGHTLQECVDFQQEEE